MFTHNYYHYYEQCVDQNHTESFQWMIQAPEVVCGNTKIDHPLEINAILLRSNFQIKSFFKNVGHQIFETDIFKTKQEYS